MFYRFACGTYIEADTFTEAQGKFIDEIYEEEENLDSWTECTCNGLSHMFNCPVRAKEIEDGDIPY